MSKSIVKTMRQSISRFLGRLSKSFGGEEVQEVVLPQPQQAVEQVSSSKTEVEEKQLIVESKNQTKKKTKAIGKKQKDGGIVTIDPRDIMESMGIPFLALSKNRKAPIVYESSDGTTKIKISCHSEHYIASIYDWDIIQCIAGKIQEVINDKKDIPPRTLIIPRHELFKGIHKQDGKKQHKDLEGSLKRLQTTLIDTTIRNEDFRYRGGFGFLDSWGYTERKDVKEFRITLSEWLYDGICKDGALLKVHQEYFDLTSGLQKILYRIARKHVGIQNKSWDFSIEELYKKSGSEQEFKKFKYDLKKVIHDNNIPGYFLEWIEENRKISIRFINARKEIKRILSETSDQPSLPFL
jgi:plasmid replication initiation protein